MKISLRHFLFSSLSLWVIVSLIGVYFLYHFHRFIPLGVDLAGGYYIELEVQTDKAIESDVLNRLQLFVEKLKKGNLELPTSTVVEKASGSLVFANPQAAIKAEDYLINQIPHYNAKHEDNKISVALTNEEIATIKREALQGNIQVLERRLNPAGASEISIVPQGEKRIIVELPGVHDIRQAKLMIGKTALLEIKLVEDSGSSEQELMQKHGGVIPENLMVVKGAERGHHDLYYLVPKYTDLTGRLLKDASMDINDMGEPVVKFEFKSEGGDKFYELTSANIGRQAAILIDNVVITAPVIQARISTTGVIQGSFTAEEADRMGKMLKSGAFVAPVTFEEERHIGPSLGEESIRNGLLACIIGMLLLLLFCIIVYKFAGLLAFIVLLYNLLLILFAFAWIKATLTLPGIAGMLLTIGMAIDASILIYERVREELKLGAPLKKAVDAGFAGSMRVILDANITHFLVSLVLYILGAGAIRGFAIAMIIGILSTLTTGILLLRSIFNFVIDGCGVQKMKF